MPKQIKIMLVGDTNVGKTTLIQTFVSEEELIFKPEPTNQVDLHFKKFKIKEGSIFINV
jgi:GTPase SAR1 family protein